VLPKTIDAIIEEQVRRWELAQREQKKEDPWPIIAVSREFGSLGAAMGRRLADRMGFSFWDQELVHQIAEQSGASEKLVASLDERARGGLEDLLRGAIFGAGGTTDQYVKQLARVQHAIAAHGGAVVIGRGTQFVLPPESLLRIRVVCPFEKRVAGYAQRQGIDPAEAERTVLNVESERRAFFRQRFGRDVADPLHYDLVVNTGSLSIDAAAELAVVAYRAKFRRLPPSAG
jgi:cytidylate kinase